MIGDTLDAVLRWCWSTDLLADPAYEERARLLLLDTLGCLAAGCRDARVRDLARQSAVLAPGRCRLPGLPVSLAPRAAASLAATAACWDEACEGLALAHGRPGLHAIPPALALAVPLGLDLRSVLAAVAAGYETGGRLGEALRILPGMHVDGNWGALGAAVAAARALGLAPRDAATSVGLVACRMPYSLYLPIAEGSLARNLYAGEGCALGLGAAMAARAGIDAPAGALDEYARRALGREDGAPPLRAPGETLLPQGYLKPFAAVRHVHYGAVAAERLRARLRGGTVGVTALRLAVYPEATVYCGNRAPETAIQAQFSLSYGLAHMLVRGHLGPAAYDDGLGDAEIRRLEALVEIEADPAYAAAGRRGARLAATAGGAVLEETVDAIPGEGALARDRAAILATFRDHAALSMDAAVADRVAAAVLDGALDDPATAWLAG